MRVLVTGGAGYIGSVVTEQLVADGHDIVVVDNLSTGHRQAVEPHCSFVEADLRDTDTLRDTLRGGIEAVLHFAARSLVPESMQDPLSYWSHNLTSSFSLVRAMRDSGVRRLVFSSTAAVYGEPDQEFLGEDLACRPQHAYGGSKRAIEMLLEDEQRAGFIDSVFLRYFNAAGATHAHGEAHEPETHLIPNLLHAASEGAPARLFGDDYPTDDGTCVRDYVHVADLARAHVRALAALGEGLRGPVNLGSGQGYSVRQVLESVQRVTGRRLAVDVHARRPGDPPRLVADITRARQALEWTPQRADLDGIVRSAWEWRRQHPRGYATGGE
jgi:UDP-glucose 4-epimerase